MKRNVRLLAIVFGVLFTAVAAVMLSPLAASAVTTLVYDDTLKDIQQTANHPCVIGSNSCGGQQTLPFTTAPAGGSANVDLTSPTYTVGQLETTVGSNAMNLLIDVNQSCGTAVNCPITLDKVEVFVAGALQFVFNGPQLVPLAGSLQGNGFSDAGLKTIDLTPFATNLTVTFHIVWSSNSDGAESFFLASTTALPGPEPSSLLLLGSGLVGVGLWARRSCMSKFMRTKA